MTNEEQALAEDAVARRYKAAADKVCTVLGLDPRQTTAFSLSVEAGQVWVRWQGARLVQGVQKAAVLEALAEELDRPVSEPDGLDGAGEQPVAPKPYVAARRLPGEETAS